MSNNYNKYVDFNPNMLYIICMKIAKVSNTAGREIYINTDLVTQVAPDLMNPEATCIHLAKDHVIVKMNVEETLKLLKGAK